MPTVPAPVEQYALLLFHQALWPIFDQGKHSVAFRKADAPVNPKDNRDSPEVLVDATKHSRFASAREAIPTVPAPEKRYDLLLPHLAPSAISDPMKHSVSFR
ncbi:hypothetical protein QAD02_021258 [Eretmocerus hayati]|uniref:Uncharacterized protein n=1 Tax=Eretmocerus hayati TaxID=131215 RepID=A0ACC2PPD8_9HYME|nr:hypothetical protein QAD02_021258 [Eretmocerus hayati]